MNLTRAVFLISDDVRAVNVTYETGDDAARTMFKTLDPDIKIDDYVVVETDSRHHMTVCKVAETDVEADLDDPKDMKWIVGVVNKADHDRMKAEEQQAITAIQQAEKRKRRKELREAMALEDEAIKKLPIYTASE